MDDGAHDPVDLDIGARIAAQRIRLNLRRDELARALGLTEQQVARYEQGAARIPVSVLFRVATALRTSVQALIGQGEPAIQDELVEALLIPGAEELLRGFARLPNEQVRRTVIALIGHLGAPRA